MNEPPDSEIPALFFCGDETVGSLDISLNRFRETFVAPSGGSWEDLKRTCEPEPGLRKMIVVSGMPRTGKTWACLSVLSYWADKIEISQSEVWFSGPDSIKLFESGANRELLLEEALERLKSLIFGGFFSDKKIVFLDDFFGTVEIRNYGDLEEAETLAREIFDPRSEFGLLRALPKGGVLVISGRSMHFAIFERLLEMDSLRDCPRHSTADIHFYSIEWGIYSSQVFDEAKTKIWGAFKKKEIDEIAERQLKWKSFEDETDSYRKVRLVVDSTLVAFSSGFFRFKEDAAKAFYGTDLDALLHEVTSHACADIGRGMPVSTKTLSLLQLYAVAIAPSLFFTGPDSYMQIFADPIQVRSALRDLNLSVTELEFGFLPNDFYAIALDQHIQSNIEEASEALILFANVASDPARQKSVLKTIIHGLSEKAHSSSGANSSQLAARLLSGKSFSSELVDLICQEEEGDTLTILWFDFLPNILKEIKNERAYDILSEDPLNQLTFVKVLPQNTYPGMVAYLGWLSYQMFGDLPGDLTALKPKGRAVKREAFFTNWLPSQISTFGNYPSEDADKRNHPFSMLSGVIASIQHWILFLKDTRERQKRSSNIWRAISGLKNLEAQELAQFAFYDQFIFSSLNQAYPPGEGPFERRLEVKLAAHAVFALRGFHQRVATDRSSKDIPDSVRRAATAWYLSMVIHNGWSSNNIGDSRRWKVKVEQHMLRLTTFEELELYDALEPDIISWWLQYQWHSCRLIVSGYMREWKLTPRPTDLILGPLSVYLRGGGSTSLTTLVGKFFTCHFERGGIGELRCSIYLYLLRLGNLGGYSVLGVEAANQRVENDPPAMREISLGVFEAWRQGVFVKAHKNATERVEIAHFVKWYLNELIELESPMEEWWHEYVGALDKILVDYDIYPNKRGWMQMVEYLGGNYGD